ncbi:Uncharacterized protein BP5553_04293 [Venustampulla echinocandica]|uniref:Uncharacterized protein n=1 Tax=Venustampulla echinocandica TaxID=2656787 RepID=A0A370TWQ0_9HELO|nr:Uncharacterized protein BP5553_04293 [Venustampulla echinocandica]RDL39953.1 Uncharacterized protein BP5553_04293 [Venustampulla echinocandica]
MAPSPRTMLSRQRTPLLIGTFIAGSSIFIGLKWRAVMQRSEAAKKATSKPANYSVDTGRSGQFAFASNRSLQYKFITILRTHG